MVSSIALDNATELARQQAEKSQHPSYRHGAVLLAGDDVVSVGFNDWRRHAEQAVLAKIPRWAKTRRLTLVVVRITRGGKLTMSRPCEDCQRAIEDAGIPEVYYSPPLEMEA